MLVIVLLSGINKGTSSVVMCWVKASDTADGKRTIQLPYTYQYTYIANRTTQANSTSDWDNTAKVRGACYRYIDLSHVYLYLYKNTGGYVSIITIGY